MHFRTSAVQGTELCKAVSKWVTKNNFQLLRSRPSHHDDEEDSNDHGQYGHGNDKNGKGSD